MVMKLLSCILCLGASAQVFADCLETRPTAVVELFTSQGCSSCPPADEFLKELKNDYHENKVIVISYHVDYWNYIGWRDPYSKAVFSQRQKRYARYLRSDSVYTPQAIINGREHFTGSRKYEIKGVIEKRLKKTVVSPAMIQELKVSSGRVSVLFDTCHEAGSATMAVLVLDSVKNRVTDGENKGKSLQHVNVAIKLKKIPAGKKSVSFEIDRKMKYKVIILSQNESDGKILSAAASEIFFSN